MQSRLLEVAGRLTKLVSPAERRGTLVDARREAFEQAYGDIAVLEGECLAQVPARGVHPSRIRPEVAIPSMLAVTSIAQNRHALEPILCVLWES